jgi:hypothetical protein
MESVSVLAFAASVGIDRMVAGFRNAEQQPEYEGREKHRQQ